jgi:hypothetical protein
MRRLTVGRRGCVYTAVGTWALLLAVNGVVGVFGDPQPVQLMKSKVEQVSGYHAKSLSVSRGGSTMDVLGKSAYLEFRVKDQPAKTVYIEMKRSLNVLPWQVTAYRVND